MSGSGRPRIGLSTSSVYPESTAHGFAWAAEVGYEAVEASNGPGALEQMKQESFPVVLLDMTMPGMNGQEVIARMPRPLPRIVLLTASDASEVNETLASGPLYYLPKEAGPDALSMILGSLHA